jgi:hypothetical protein
MQPKRDFISVTHALPKQSWNAFGNFCVPILTIQTSVRPWKRGAGMLSGTFTKATILVLFSYVADSVTKEAADHASFMRIAPTTINFPD